MFSGLPGAVIGFLINLASGGRTSQLLWIGLVFALLVSVSITAWQGYTQEKAGKQWLIMLHEEQLRAVLSGKKFHREP